MPDQIEMLRPTDIAERLGVTASRVYQMISDRVIPAVRVGGAIRIPRAAWDEWLRGRSEEALAGVGRAKGERSAAAKKPSRGAR